MVESIERNVPQAEAAHESILNLLRRELTLANGLSAVRPFLVMVANKTKLENPLFRGLMGSAFAIDSLDGMAARRNGGSRLGGLIDIIADHAVEFLMYARLKKEGIVPAWVPVVVGVRDVITDTIRASHIIVDPTILDKDKGVLKIEDSNLSESIIGSNVSRTGYALLKAVVALTAPSNPKLAKNLAIAAAGLSIIRGIPVLFNRENKKLVDAFKKIK